MIKPKKECITCGAETDDFYTIKTNKGDMFRCAKCFEIVFQREQRNEYANYGDISKSAKSPRS